MPEEAPRKRSRFDQTEPEPRKSRFDRRSRSPVSRHSESRRSRSPVGRDVKSPSHGDVQKAAADPAAAAAAAAAKINAGLQARKGIQHVDVPPIQPSAASPTPTATPATPASQGTTKLDNGIYIADDDYIKDIEVNDLRNRYTLTKGSTQKMIKEETGADVTTRGSYYPDKTLATAANPPLYLHVTSTTKEGLEAAIGKIEELMQQELPNLVDERRFRKREPEFERDELGRRKWPEAKIPIDMENIPGFNLRAQVVGQGGAYVKHIQQETRCRVQIKGRGSGFMEHSTGQESDEPMFLHVASPDAEQVDRAKKLCEDLLTSVRSNYEHYKANPPAQRMASYTDGYGADAHRNSHGGGYGRDRDSYRDRDRDRGDRGDRDRGRDNYSSGYGGHDRHHGHNNSYGQNNSNNHHPHNGSDDNGGGLPHESYNSPYPTNPVSSTPIPGSAVAESPSTAQDYQEQWAQYYSQNPTADPYAAYGGYQAYMQAYYQYYGQQQPQQGQQQVSGGGDAPPPPPPASDPAAAPPPPPSGGYSGYNAVPPPPGM